MDIQKIIKEALDALQKDDKLVEKFMANPVPTLEAVLKIDLPDDQITAVVNGIKAKLNVDDALKQVKGAADLLGGLFGKK